MKHQSLPHKMALILCFLALASGLPFTTTTPAPAPTTVASRIVEGNSPSTRIPSAAPSMTSPSGYPVSHRRLSTSTKPSHQERNLHHASANTEPFYAPSDVFKTTHIKPKDTRRFFAPTDVFEKAELKPKGVVSADTKPFFAPVDVFKTKKNEAKDTSTSEMEMVLDEIRQHKRTEPFFAPYSLSHPKKTQRKATRLEPEDGDEDIDNFIQELSRQNARKEPEPFYAPFDLFHQDQPSHEGQNENKIVPKNDVSSLGSHRNDTPKAPEDSGKDLLQILEEHANVSQIVSQDSTSESVKETPTESPDIHGDDAATTPGEQEKDLLQIIEEHRQDAPVVPPKHVTTDGSHETTQPAVHPETQSSLEDGENLWDILEKHKNDPHSDSQLDRTDTNADTRPQPMETSRDTANEEKMESNDAESHQSMFLQDGIVAPSDNVVTQPTMKEHSGLLEDVDITVVIAVASAASVLLIVLLVVVVSAICCCGAEARAKRKEKEMTTLNKDMNRWDPQMLRPSKESVDAFMFGPPIPSVSEMFSKSVLQLNPDAFTSIDLGSPKDSQNAQTTTTCSPSS